MSTKSVPPGGSPHDEFLRRAMEAEIAAFHLRGWAMLVAGLCELRAHSTYDRMSEDGVSMVMCEAFRRLADKLEPQPTETPERPPLTVVRPETSA